mmetsp:Transcript_8365/g.25965  ORF Transcript_8365/g.25965 Transcript_8365/m.25965 type:complete len:342 (+) Transcript_8365:177-1202(+)
MEGQRNECHIFIWSKCAAPNPLRGYNAFNPFLGPRAGKLCMSPAYFSLTTVGWNHSSSSSSSSTRRFLRNAPSPSSARSPPSSFPSSNISRMVSSSFALGARPALARFSRPPPPAVSVSPFASSPVSDWAKLPAGSSLSDASLPKSAASASASGSSTAAGAGGGKSSESESSSPSGTPSAARRLRLFALAAASAARASSSFHKLSFASNAAFFSRMRRASSSSATRRASISAASMAAFSAASAANLSSAIRCASTCAIVLSSASFCSSSIAVCRVRHRPRREATRAAVTPPASAPSQSASWTSRRSRMTSSLAIAMATFEAAVLIAASERGGPFRGGLAER